MTRVPINPISGARNSQGFTLLEALVAVVVISIGLLGLLGLQTVAVVNTQVSQSRTMASIAADDIADRIRANQSGANNGDYNAIADPYDREDGAQPPTDIKDCVNASCNAADIAKLDAWEWGRTIHESLRGKGYVDCREPTTPSSADPCRTFEIAVIWQERNRADPALEPASGDLCDDQPDRFQDRCFMTVIRP